LTVNGTSVGYPHGSGRQLRHATYAFGRDGDVGKSRRKALTAGYADGESGFPAQPPAARWKMPHFHSIVSGGLLVTSYTTRLTPFTSLMIRVAAPLQNPNGTSSGPPMTKARSAGRPYPDRAQAGGGSGILPSDGELAVARGEQAPI